MKMFGKSVVVMVVLSVSFLFAEMAIAQEPYVYPQKGQSKAQLEQDRAACLQWARSQTGFDPAAASAAVPAEPTGGHAVRGAARGAALGAIGGAIAGDAGKGAAIGAAVGGTGGLLKRRRERKANEQAAQNHNAATSQAAAAYYRAYGACMSGRGYSVK